MRIEILTKIGFEPRTQTPGAVLSVPGDATPLEAEDWVSRGLARVVKEAPVQASEAPAANPERPAKSGKKA